MLVCVTIPATAQLVGKRGSDDFRVGIAGYTFRKFTVEQSLRMVQTAGVKYMSVKDFHLPLTSTAEQMAAFKKLLASYGVDGYILGPIYMRSREQVDAAFEYVKRYGVDMFIGVPNYDLLPYMEQKVKEYDIRVAIHTHGPDGHPFPDASDVVERTKGMDKRIGICLDLGHTVRLGGDNVKDIMKYADRIFDIHFKDVTAPSKAGTTCEMGRGVIDYNPIIEALRKTGYKGVVCLEFEKDPENPLNGVLESIGYFKGITDAK